MWKGASCAPDLTGKPLEDLSVGQMSAIPREQVVSACGSGDSQVHGVASCLGWQTTRG